MDDQDTIDVKALKNKYPPNSHSERIVDVSETKSKKIIKGTVITRKKTFGKRFLENFFSENISTYIVNDILVPAAKATLSDSIGYFFDSIRSGVETLIYGEIRSTTVIRRDNRGRGSHVNYDKVSYNSRDVRDPSRIRQNRSRHDFSDIIFTTRMEALEVRNHLADLIDQYNVACVSDLYDAVGITSNFTDNKYGWDNLSAADIRRVSNGYLINFPRPILID